MANRTKINTESQDIIQLLSRDDVEKQFGEAVASVIPHDQIVSWAKFVLTDDRPNENRQRIPAEEFDNIIKTGVFKPLKMAVGRIEDGHEDAEPLGVITHLTKDGNKIVALAALWDKEREADVTYVKNLVNSNKPVNVSWEILYGDYRLEDGIAALLDTVLRAVTIVGLPAYAGRTQLIAVAAKKWTDSYVASLPDTSFLHIDRDGSRHFAYRDHTGKIDVQRFKPLMEEISESHLPVNTLKGIKKQVLRMQAVIQADASLRELLDAGEFTLEDSTLDTKELESRVSELENKLATAGDDVAKKSQELSEALSRAEAAEQKLVELEQEIQPLREFKQEADELQAKAEKLSAIKEKFVASGLEKPEEYFESNSERLLALDEAGLDFLLQEMVAFKGQEGGEGSASVRNPSVPNVPGNIGELDVKSLAQALRDSKKTTK